MKICYVVLELLALTALVSSSPIKLVGPDETEEDLNKPIKEEYQITWYRFRHYFADGNTQWKVFEIARKYYINKDTNITFANFLQAGKEYIIADLVNQRLSFQALGHLIVQIQPALVYYMNELKNKTFSLEEFFRHTCQGRFKSFMRVGINFKEQPWEVQQRLVHELEVKKRKTAFLSSPHHHDPEQDYIYGHSHKVDRNLDLMRKEEIGRRFREVYNQIEWLEDGRRVTDEDYQEEFPTRERTLHKYAQSRENNTKEVVDELLSLELDMDL